MTDPRKIAEDIEAGGGATVEQRRTLARAYLALVSDLPVVIEAAKRVIDLYDEDQMDSLGFAARRMTAMTALRSALAEVDRG